MTFKWHATRPLSIDSVGEFWEVRYTQNVTPWDRGRASPALAAWLDCGAISPGRILIPGCGRGHEVLELARRGFEATGLDISPTAIRELGTALQQAGLHAELIASDLFRWTPAERFDAVYEQACLCDLLPEQWAGYVGRLTQWTKSDGLLFIQFMQTGKAGGPPFHCDLDSMRELFSDVSWLWPDSEPIETHHPSGFCELGHILRRC